MDPRVQIVAVAVTGGLFFLVFELVRHDPEAPRWWPKATRMFLAVLARHVGRQHQMAAEDRSVLATRARQVLSLIPPEVLAAAYASGKPDRQALLAPYVLGRTAILRRRRRGAA